MMGGVPSARRTKVPGAAREGQEDAARSANGAEQALLEDLRSALRAVREGDFSTRLSTRRRGLLGEIAAEFNELAATNQRMAKELVRVGRIIGREGRMTERAALADASGEWQTSIDSVNALIDDLVRPTTEVARVIMAVAEGDLSQKIALRGHDLITVVLCGSVGSNQGAVLAFQPARFPGPPSEPGVRVSTHRALHQFMPLHRSWPVALCLPMAMGCAAPGSGIG
jgi:HAMP domain-containing protein